MESWMILAGVGGLLGLGSLVGMTLALKKLHAPAKWIVVAGLALVGAVGGYLSANATALTTTEEEAAIEEQIEDFDAPLDDDW